MVEIPRITLDEGVLKNVPVELKRRRQWVCWRYKVRDGKLVKVPVAPWSTGHNEAAGVNDPNNMATFEIALEYSRRNGWGIGFCFFGGDGLAGTDIDDCRNPETGELTGKAKEIITLLKSYAEASPSGRGVHVIAKGKISAAVKNSKEGVEIYDRDRFFTITGEHVAGTPLTIVEAGDALKQLEQKYGARRVWTSRRAGAPTRGGEFRNRYGWSLDDIRARDKKLDELVSTLRPAGYPSPSEADMATLSELLFWGYSESEAVDILRHFRGREKLNREDYIRMTLEKIVPAKTIADYVDPSKWTLMDGYDLPTATAKKPSARLGDYTLKLWGDVVLVLDREGKALYHTKLGSLYSLSQRKALAQSVGVPLKEVDRAVAAVMQQKLRLDQTMATSKRAEAKSEEAKTETVERAEALLADPHLLCHIAEGFHKAGLVGETKNGLLTYLTHVSSKLPDPINQRYSSRASIGKSTIVTRVAQLWPPEDLIIRGGLTKKSLYYLPEAEDIDENTRRLELRGKVLIVLEESESKEFLNEVKPLLSHDVPVLKYSFVEERVTRTVLLEGWPAYLGVTTVPIKGEEHQTRTLLTSPDRGREKYGAVIDDDAERHAFPWMYRSPDLEVFHEVARRLKPLRVCMPWLPIVSKEFPRGKAASMRDWKKLRTYIEAVAFLHQRQRPRIVIDGVEYVVAIPLDLEIATKIVEGAMAETVMGLERDVKEFYDFINEKALTVEETEEVLQDETKKDELKDTFTYKDLMRWYEECFGEPVSKTTLRDRYVEKLEDLGLLEIDDSKKPYKISLCSESSASLANFEKALSRVRSEETKAEVIRETSAKLGGVQGEFFDAFEKSYSYTLSDFADLKKLLERSKNEEYPEKIFFFKSAKDAEDNGLTLGEKMKLVYDKARELATDSTVSKFKVADSLKGRLERREVFDLLEKLAEEGKLAPKGIESYRVVGE